MKTTTIKGYNVTLKPARIDTPSECWVTRGNYEGSLSLLLGNGELAHAVSGEGSPVARSTIDAIMVWADANGY